MSSHGESSAILVRFRGWLTVLGLLLVMVVTSLGESGHAWLTEHLRLF